MGKGNKKKLLIVDDVELNRAILSAIFEQSYTVLEAENGEEALQLIGSHMNGLEVVLLDIVMPVMGGFEVLEEIRQKGWDKKVPIVLITAEVTEDIVRRGTGFGVMDIIAKPFAPNITMRVNQAVELYSYRQGRTPGALGAAKQEEERRRVSDQSGRILNLIQAEREKYRMLTENSGEITFEYDVLSDEIVFSERFREVFGGDIRLQNVRASLHCSGLIAAEDYYVVKEIVSEASPARNVLRKRFRLKTILGYQWFEAYIHTIWNDREPPSCVGMVGKITNINELKSETAIWQERALRDDLTGLYTRAAFQSQVEAYIQDYPSQMAAMIFVDLDHFKDINDTHGHIVGDHLLVYVGKRLQECFRSTDVTARFGGDEFVAFIEHIASNMQLDMAVDRLMRIFDEPVSIDGRQIKLSGSVGVARFPQDGSNYDELLQAADQALYHAKGSGRGRASRYNNSRKGEKYLSRLSETER